MNLQLPTYPEDHRPVGVGAMLDLNPMEGERRTGSRRFWTVRELKILRETFPAGGMPACIKALPGRSAASIYNRAGAEGLRKRNAEGGVTERRVWAKTPQIDEAIRRVYAGEPSLGAVKALAVTIGRPRSWISARARDLGLSVPRFKELPWSDAEYALLDQLKQHHPAVIRRRFHKAGFKRTAVAISLKLKRMRIDGGEDPEHFNLLGLAEAFGVSREVVSKWIERGYLKAKKREARAVTAKPGDNGVEWEIHRRDIRRFVIDNTAIVDFRKVDKFWLIDLLADKGAK